MKCMTMKLRPIGHLLKALTDPSAPILAQLVVTRRCNLSCAYCNEYDQFSLPVATGLLRQYVDHLARLGTGIVTLTGGETLLHPHLEETVAHVVSRHMVCTSVTNGYLLTPERIEKLNRSGLGLLQVSIDNLEPDETSRKSLTRIRGILHLLKDRARFRVNLNAVLGSVRPAETRALVDEIHSLGFDTTVSVLHNGGGAVDRALLGEKDLERLFARIQASRRRTLPHRFGEGWELRMLRTGQSDWKCRAGSRYLYVDEFGIVSFCSQRRGEPGIPLLEYGRAEIKRFFPQRKGCEPRCTLGCVRRASAFDRFRFQQTGVEPPVAEQVAGLTRSGPAT
jgi:MoaA/NifB/PqqE/SkfB family radical SAM enzyme